MKQSKTHSLILFSVQLSVWLLLILTPAAICYVLDPQNPRYMLFFFRSAGMLVPQALIYFISFYITVPYIWFKNQRLLYSFATLLLICFVHIHIFIADMSWAEDFIKAGYYSYASVILSTGLIVSLAALFLRNYLKTYQLQLTLQEEKRKSAEAELNWLKNQLNPHFLFNSLNNISSLTQIDADKAQEAIGQLSDLLRYALYESNKPKVLLSGEIEFMRNYISMMQLRCSEKTTINVDFSNDTKGIEIAPLLFISFIENSFKHGTSNSQDSVINISLNIEGGKKVRFQCSNTNNPKGDSDHSGSGIGMENTRRRLDLLYPNQYEWTQTIENEIFKIEVSLYL